MMKHLAHVMLVAVTLFLSGAVIVPAADAATPTCTRTYEPDDHNNSSARLRVPATSGNSTNCLLAVGNASSAVIALQMSLNTCYGAGIAEDGIFGAHTQSALRAAQRREGVTADGIYGPNTSRALRFASINEVTDARRCGSGL